VITPQPQQTVGLGHTLLVLRVQGWAWFVVAVGWVVLFFWTIAYDTGDHSLIGVALLFAAWAAILGVAVLFCLRLLTRGTPGARIYTISAELLVLFTTWWLWPLFLITIAAPVYVIVTMVRLPSLPSPRL
jgi:hypothetical protein